MEGVDAHETALLKIEKKKDSGTPDPVTSAQERAGGYL
jgi:hypothetical protein